MSTVTPPATGRAWPTIRLVASREIMTRIRSKAFLITTAILVIGVVAGALVINFAGSSGPDAQKVGFTSDAASLVEPVTTAAESLGATVETSTVADRAAGEAAVTAGDLDALVTGTATDIEVVVDADLDPGLSAALTSVSQQAALAGQITELGGDPSAVSSAVGQAAPTVTELEPDDAFDPARLVAGLATGILIFVTLITTGQLIAQGVVEEKQSRVVEILLATVRPWHLMVGKVLGIGLIGLAQVVLVAGAAAGSAAALGLVDASTLDVGPIVVWVVVWYVLGFVTYAFALAAAGSLVSRQEDIGSVIAPFTTLMMIPYIIGVSIAPYDPDNALVRWLSYIPFCSPLLMPVRTAVGSVEPWEIALAVVLSVAVIPVLVWLSSRIYSNAVLRTGSRIKVRDALRAA